FVPLTRKGITYEGKPELFLETTGDQGFAPVALRVHPNTGDLYVAIGGRGTRGAVYRVRYLAGVRGTEGFVTPPLPPKVFHTRHAGARSANVAIGRASKAEYWAATSTAK